MTVQLSQPTGRQAADFDRQVEQIEQRQRIEALAKTAGGCILAGAGMFSFIQEQTRPVETGDPEIDGPIKLAASVLGGVSAGLGIAWCLVDLPVSAINVLTWGNLDNQVDAMEANGSLSSALGMLGALIGAAASQSGQEWGGLVGATIEDLQSYIEQGNSALSVLAGLILIHDFDDFIEKLNLKQNNDDPSGVGEQPSDAIPPGAVLDSNDYQPKSDSQPDSITDVDPPGSRGDDDDNDDDSDHDDDDRDD